MKRIIFILVAVLSCYSAAFAKQPQEPSSYNYMRGKELINNREYSDGVEMLQKELADNPKNGYAYMWLTFAYLNQDEIGNLLQSATDALKYLPKKDAYARAYIYSRMGVAYGYYLNDTVQALQYYNQAIKTEPKNAQWYNDRGRYYVSIDRKDEAIADYKTASDLEPNSAERFYYLGKAYQFANRNKEALDAFTKADLLDSNYQTLAARAWAEIQVGKYEDAAKHIIASLDKNPHNDDARELLIPLPAAMRRNLLTEFHIKQRLNPNDPNWILYEMGMLAGAYDFEKALAVTGKLETLIPQQHYASLRYMLYDGLGDYESALREVNLAMELDSTDYSLLNNRADIYNDMGRTDLQLADLDSLIEKVPDNAEYYSHRAYAYLFMEQYQKAIEDLDMAIALSDKLSYRYLRGRCYYELGDTLAARSDFEKAAKGNDSYACYSLHFIGNDALATHKMDSILVADSLDQTEAYKAARLYALQGKTEDVYRMLTIALETRKSLYSFIHRNIDFRSIRGERFDSLIAVYEGRVQETIRRVNGTTAETNATERVVEVPFSPANGVTTVKCSINGLPLTFIFDTGASDVTISQTESSFMYKNGYLSKKDIVGNSAYMTADGAISIGTNIILQKINFGGLELKAVRASVVGNQKAPLLLGQSVLQRLGKIEIDNQRQVLKITTKAQ